MVSEFLRPVAIRVTSSDATAPPEVRSVAQAASSTVTSSGPSAPMRRRTKVSVDPETDTTSWPSRKRTWSTACEARSPSAPEPAVSLRIRHVIGASASASQSWR